MLIPIFALNSLMHLTCFPCLLCFGFFPPSELEFYSFKNEDHLDHLLQILSSTGNRQATCAARLLKRS